MNALLQSMPDRPCVMCGIPLDAQYFDASGFIDLRGKSGEFRAIVLADFELPPQYCGVLQYFFQFSDALAADPARIFTPDLEWNIRVNGHPLHPYLGFRHIINPWGSPCCPVAIRLDEGARLEFAVRRVPDDTHLGPDKTLAPVHRVGARLVGRYWYNSAYGTVA